MSDISNEMILQAILEIKSSVQQVVTKVDGLETRFDGLEIKVDGLNAKIESVRIGLKHDLVKAVETIMAGFESVYDKTKTDNEYIKAKVSKHDEDIFSIKARFSRLQKQFDEQQAYNE